MNAADLIPASLVAAITISGLVVAQVLPFGQATVLVSLATTTPQAAMAAASRTGAALLAVPSPGTAVLRGDAGKIRARLGLAVLWAGAAPCEVPP